MDEKHMSDADKQELTVRSVAAAKDVVAHMGRVLGDVQRVFERLAEEDLSSASKRMEFLEQTADTADSVEKLIEHWPEFERVTGAIFDSMRVKPDPEAGPETGGGA